MHKSLAVDIRSIRNLNHRESSLETSLRIVMDNAKRDRNDRSTVLHLVWFWRDLSLFYLDLKTHSVFIIFRCAQYNHVIAMLQLYLDTINLRPSGAYFFIVRAFARRCMSKIRLKCLVSRKEIKDIVALR